MKKIILISGKAQHGKDTLALHVKQRLEEQGNKVAVDHFARPIKSILKNYYNWDGVTKDDYWRGLLQMIGTDNSKVKLNMVNVWCNRICQDIQIIQDDFDYILIPDCRFRQEIHGAIAYYPDDVISLRVHRLNFESSLTEEQKNHVSETDLDNYNSWDGIIYNQSLSSLHDEADRVLTRLGLIK